MPDPDMLRQFLAGAGVDAAVFALRPDYRALLLAVDGLVPGPGDQDSDALLQAAEAATYSVTVGTSSRPHRASPTADGPVSTMHTIGSRDFLGLPPHTASPVRPGGRAAWRANDHLDQAAGRAHGTATSTWAS